MLVDAAVLRAERCDLLAGEHDEAGDEDAGGADVQGVLDQAIPRAGKEVTMMPATIAPGWLIALINEAPVARQSAV